MTIVSEIPETWPDAIVDIGPIQLCRGHWGVVGFIAYEGHVVLAVIPGPGGLQARRRMATDDNG